MEQRRLQALPLTDASRAVAALAALAQETRLAIFRLLIEHAADGLTPGAIARKLELPAATLSFHLKELTNSGLVTQERASRYLVYRAAYDRMNGLLGYLTENCCQGAACAVEATGETCKC